MASYAASLLDELMGRHRNANLDDKPKEAHWSDTEVVFFFFFFQVTSQLQGFGNLRTANWRTGNAVTMPPKKFVGTIRRFAKPPTDVTYVNIHHQ